MQAPSRTIPFDAVFNFRDLGGYPAVDGTQVAWRRLFRADGLNRLVEDEGERFRDLGITTVIDLRTPEEVENRGRIPAAIAEVDYRHLPLFDVMPTWPPDDDNNPRYLAERYMEMVDAGQDTVARVLELLARPATYPAVFHCAAGKDRTGIIAAVVLGLLGVPDEVIADDYALSHAAMEILTAWVATNMPEASTITTVPASVLGADAATMHAFLGDVRGRYGSVEGMARALGADGAVVGGVREQLLVGG